jgi:AraC family transcriptional regulator
MQQHGGLEIRSEHKPNCGTKRNDAHGLYKGWLSVERSMYRDMDSYVTERLQLFSGGWLEVRNYRWSQPVEVIWSTEKRCYLLSMALDGQEKASVVTDLKTGQRRELDLKARMIMVPPEQLLRCNSEAGQVRSLRCVLDSELVESFLNAIPMWDWSQVPLNRTHNLSGGQIEWLLRRMYREICQPDFATVSVIEALAKQLSVEILRKFCPPRADRSEFWGGLSPRHRRLIRERVHSREPLPDRGELADLCDMTIRHLSRAFRTETGQTLGRYIDSVMVDRANAMLMAGASVRDVADSLGYATASSFTSAFRRATGLLPREVKANKKGRSLSPQGFRETPEVKQ